MKKKINPFPDGYHSVTPNLVIRGAKQAIDFYKKALGAEVTFLQERPDGKIMHAEIKIGDSVLMLADECQAHKGHDKSCVRSPSDLGGTSTNLYLYVDNADETFHKAVDNGAEIAMPVTDMFWGDRVGMFRDPFGHFWSVATHEKKISSEQMKDRMRISV